MTDRLSSLKGLSDSNDSDQMYGCTGSPDYYMFANIFLLCRGSGILSTRGGQHVQQLDKRWQNLHYVCCSLQNKWRQAIKSIYHGCLVWTEIPFSQDHCLASLGNPCEAKQWPLRWKFLFVPHSHERYLQSLSVTVWNSSASACLSHPRIKLLFQTVSHCYI